MEITQTIKNKLPTKERMKKFFTRKRIIWGSIGLIVLLIVLGIIFGGQPTKPTVEAVTRGPLTATVLATGQVTSTTDLNLSFSASDVVRSIRVQVGDKVKQGQIIATLDQKDESANATSARGALLAAQARFNKVQEGASTEETRVAQVALDNAKKDLEITREQQATLVRNARRALLNNDLTPRSTSYTTTTPPTITGTYDSSIEGTYEIFVYSSSAGGNFSYSGVESGIGIANTTTPTPLGTKGLYIQFASGAASNNGTWIVSLPNTQGANYITLLNAYNAALETQKNAVSSAEAIVAQRQAEFDLKTAGARSVELDAVRADVISAEGRYQSALVALENTILRAPSNGTITRIDMKLGELLQAFKPVLGLQDTENLYLEANVNEANIASVAVGQDVDVTFDAFGPDMKVTAKITTVEPSSTLVSGVVNYKIKAALPKVENVRPGMTANMTIRVAERADVLQVPSRSIIDVDGQTVVRVITNEKKGTYQEVPVVVGLEGDGGKSEIISGLTEGQNVVVLLNEKKK